MKKILLVVVLLMGAGYALETQYYEENIAACNAGGAKACYTAGKIHSAEAYKKRDYDSAIAAAKVAFFYKQSCELGFAKGCTAYGMSYTADQNKDPEKDANYYFQKGCDGGDPAGCNILKMAPKKDDLSI